MSRARDDTQDRAQDRAPGQPLAGARLVEVGGTLAAAAATGTFADYGASVIKVEPAAGSAMRRLPPFPGDRPHIETGAFHLALDTGKRSIALDVTSPSGLEVLGRLCADADLLFVDLPPADAERALAVAAGVRAATVAITPHGLDGPYRDRAESDISVFAWTTRMHRHSIAGEEPLRYAPGAAALQVGATAAAAGIAALWSRDHGSERAAIEIAAVEALAGNVDTFFTIWSLLGAELPPNAGGPSTLAYPAGNHRCADGYVLFAASGEPFFSRLCRGIGHPELPGDPRFADPIARAGHFDDFMQYLQPWLDARTREQVFGELQREGVMVAPVLDISEALSDAQARARCSSVRIDHPVAGEIAVPGPPFRMAEGWRARPAPRLGEHTAEILDALGYSRDEQIALFRAGVTG